MMSDNIILPYNSKLAPDERKQRLLNDTFNWFDMCNEVFFDFVKNLYGGVKHEHLILVNFAEKPKKVSNSKKPKKKDQEVNIHVEPNQAEWVDNACATFWFRLQAKSTVQLDQSVQTAEERIRRFRDYAGHEPSSFAKSYLNGNYDPEKTEWVDCRLLYVNFCRNLNVNLDADIRTMVEHNLLPVLPGQDFKTNNVFSNIFGVGNKEDKGQKTNWLNTVSEGLQSKEIWNWDEYRDLISRSTGCSTAAELRSESIGRPSMLAVDFASEKSGQISQEWLAERVKSFRAAASQKSKIYDMPNRLVLKEYIASKIGPFKLERWSAAAVSAYKDVRSKNSINLLYSKERLWRCKEIAQILVDNTQVAEAQQILVNYSSGDTNSFTVENRHMGDLTVLFKIWEKMDMDSGIEQYSEIYRDEYSRDPITELLRYLYNHRHISAKTFRAAARLNSLLLKNDRKKIHPTISGRTSVSFGHSTIKGCITPPDHIVKNRKENAGSTGMIWVTMQLIDNGRWADHHIPFHNSRYYRDFYAYRADLPTISDPRRKSFGHRIGNNISDTRMINHDCKKASKMYLRTIQNMTHNVAFDQQTQFAVRRYADNNFTITIQARVVGRKYKKEISVGDRVMGVDQNQTTSNTYSVWEVVAEGTENSYPYKGNNYRLVEDGFIRSECSGRDQLSYDGLDFQDFAQWRRERYAFLSSVGCILNDEIEPQIPVSAEKAKKKKKFSKWRGCSLYSWNLCYAYYLKGLMHENLANNPAGFRQEILNFIQGSRGVRLCSLNHTSFRLLSKAKSLIHSFFGLNNIKDPESQRDFDPEIYDIMVNLTQRKTNKRKEKANRITSSILQIANRLNVSRIVIENDLPNASSKNKASANQRATDWCARNVSEKLEYACKMLGISLWQIDPRDTSHLDPFVVGKEARFMKIKVSDINEYTISNFKKWHANIATTSTTAPLYHDALKAFSSHYGIDWDNLPEMKFWELKNALKDHKEVFIPNRGGRCYLSTLPVTSTSEKIVFNGRERWLNASDIVAGVNIVLRSV